MTASVVSLTNSKLTNKQHSQKLNQVIYRNDRIGKIYRKTVPALK